ncbi:hypothetical protein CO725_24205 [Vibrio parahaemolyticus]|uniref:hypothetical protein n=1 Tax=Vibrio parahaemolyticus TaxID=670 RepID=UPI000BE441AB|nr:hypothetical protein [Vibrio parahaemolyticus]ATI48527.1 hypothetical protein CO725_24205 [Vibrio parahaemolyticus]
MRKLNKKRYGLINVSAFQAKAPTLYKHLLENDLCRPLETNDSFIVIQFRPYNVYAKEAAKSDGFDSVLEPLRELVECELKADEEIESVYALAVTDFNIL